MKNVTINNLTLKFKTDDKGADVHTAYAMLDEVNVLLKKRFGVTVDCPTLRGNLDDVKFEDVIVRSDKKMTKKAFKKLATDCHIYGSGARKHNTFFYDYKQGTDFMNRVFRGHKYAVTAQPSDCPKGKLLDVLYDWAIKGIEPPYYVRYKYAIEDTNRFNIPISLNF